MDLNHDPNDLRTFRSATSCGAGQELFCLVAVTESLAFISHLAWLVVDIPGTPSCEAASTSGIQIASYDYTIIYSNIV